MSARPPRPQMGIDGPGRALELLEKEKIKTKRYTNKLNVEGTAHDSTE